MVVWHHLNRSTFPTELIEWIQHATVHFVAVYDQILAAAAVAVFDLHALVLVVDAIVAVVVVVVFALADDLVAVHLVLVIVVQILPIGLIAAESKALVFVVVAQHAKSSWSTLESKKIHPKKIYLFLELKKKQTKLSINDLSVYIMKKTILFKKNALFFSIFHLNIESIVFSLASFVWVN